MTDELIYINEDFFVESLILSDIPLEIRLEYRFIPAQMMINLWYGYGQSLSSELRSTLQEVNMKLKTEDSPKDFVGKVTKVEEIPDGDNGPYMSITIQPNSYEGNERKAFYSIPKKDGIPTPNSHIGALIEQLIDFGIKEDTVEEAMLNKTFAWKEKLINDSGKPKPFPISLKEK